MNNSTEAPIESASGPRWGARLFEPAMVTMGLAYGGWMLLDAYGPRSHPETPVGSLTGVDAIEYSESIFPISDDGGRWSFAGIPWVVEFSYGDAARSPAHIDKTSLTEKVIPDLEKLLIELGAKRTSSAEADHWIFQRTGVTLSAITRSTPEGVALLRLDVIGDEGVLNPSEMRMSFRPCHLDAVKETEGHILPLSNRCVPICGRVRSDGKLSLEVIRSPGGVGDRDVRFYQAGWRQISKSNDPVQLWERLGKRVSLFDIRIHDTPSSELVWMAILQD